MSNAFTVRTHFTALTLLIALAITLSSTSPIYAATNCDTTPTNPIGQPLGEEEASSSLITGCIPQQPFTATTLLDGRILVVGGEDSSDGDQASRAYAQIYDPASGLWTDVSRNGLPARRRHTATLLADGRVLFAGGFGGKTTNLTTLSSCALYDPKASPETSWDVIDRCLNMERGNHTATRLNDGSILMAGGNVSGSRGSLGSAEICTVDDRVPGGPATCMKEDLTIPRSGHTATRLEDGRVWITGTIEEFPTHRVEIYNPGSSPGSNWSLGPDSTRRYNHSTVALRSGLVVSFGGTESEGTPNTADSLDVWIPHTGAVLTANLSCSFPRPPGATLLPDDSVLLFGGDPPPGSDDPCVEQCKFDTTGHADCQAIGDLRDVRPDLTATLLAGGRTLVLGAGTRDGTPGEIYFVNPSTPLGSMTKLDGMQARAGHTSTLLANGDLLVAGGQTSQILTEGPKGFTWLEPENLGDIRAFHTATLIQDNRVLLTGGSNQDGELLKTTEKYNPTGGWADGPEMNCSRRRHTATRLWDGRVLVVGGEGECSDPNSDVSLTYEIFDPPYDQSPAIGFLPALRPRIGHTATLLEDGRVMVTGGEDNNRIDFFDPTAGFDDEPPWVTSPSVIRHTHQDHTATMLADGRVLLLGGETDFVEILSVARNGTSVSSQEAFPREDHLRGQVTLLPDGRVLRIGNTSNTGQPSTRNFIFEPTTWATPIARPTNRNPAGLWFGVAPSEVGREAHGVTLLPNQQVMISGGQVDGSPTSSAELFDLDLGFGDAERPIVDQLMTLEADSACTLMDLSTCVDLATPLRLGQRWLIRGQGLLGTTEGSGGQGNQQAANDMPVVQLRSLINEQVRAVNLQAIAPDALLTEVVTNFPPGPSLLTVFVNGVPSLAHPVEVTYAAELRVTSAASANFAAAAPNNPDLKHTFRLFNHGVVNAHHVEVDLGLLLAGGSSSNIGIRAIASVEGERSRFLAVESNSIVWDIGTLKAGEAVAVTVIYDLCPATSTAEEDCAAASGIDAITSHLTKFRSLEPLIRDNVQTNLTTPVLPGNLAADLRVSITDFRGAVEPGHVLYTQLNIENVGLGAAIQAIATSNVPGFENLDQLGCECQSPKICQVGPVSGMIDQLEITLGAGDSCQWTLLSEAVLPGSSTIPPGTMFPKVFGPIISHRLGVSTQSGTPGGWEDLVTENNNAIDLTIVQSQPPESKELDLEIGDFPAAAAKPEEFLVVFQDGPRPEDSTARILGKFLDAFGQETTINPFPTNFEGTNPDVTYDHNKDKYVVVWEGNECLTFGKKDGFRTLKISEDQNECETGRYPAIASSPRTAGNPRDILTWMAYLHRNSFGRFEIKIASPDYAPPDPIFPMEGDSDDFALDESRPRIAVRDHETVAVAWSEPGEGVFALLLNPPRPLLPSDPTVPAVPLEILRLVRLDTGNTAVGREPDIAYDLTTDRFYVVWRRPSGKIEARFLPTDPTAALGNLFPVNLPPLNNRQFQPRIDCHNARCSVVWQRISPIEMKETIVAQLFSTQGSFIGDEVQVNVEGDTEDERLPVVVFAPDSDPTLDRFLVAWATDDNNSPEVHARIFPLNSMLLKTGPNEDGFQQNFEINVDWTEPTNQEPLDRKGLVPKRVPFQPLDNVGYFWFFDSENIEVLVKLLEFKGNTDDNDPNNDEDSLSIAYASLTERPFELTVRDCGLTSASEPADCTGSELMRIPSQPLQQCGGSSPFPVADTQAKTSHSMCTCPSETPYQTLFGRFETRVCWRAVADVCDDFQPALPLGGIFDSSLGAGGSSSTGEPEVSSAVFTFLLAAPQANPEVVVKMIDTNQDDRFWVFYGGATNLEYIIEITDTKPCDEDEVCEPETTSFLHPAGDYCGGNDLDFVPLELIP